MSAALGREHSSRSFTNTLYDRLLNSASAGFTASAESDHFPEELPFAKWLRCTRRQRIVQNDSLLRHSEAGLLGDIVGKTINSVVLAGIQNGVRIDRHQIFVLDSGVRLLRQNIQLNRFRGGPRRGDPLGDALDFAETTDGPIVETVHPAVFESGSSALVKPAQRYGVVTVDDEPLMFDRFQSKIVLAVLQLGHGDVVHTRRDGGHEDVSIRLLALGVDGGNGPTDGSATPYGTIIHKRPGYHATVVNSHKKCSYDL